jgi:hypothetical protein
MRQTKYDKNVVEARSSNEKLQSLHQASHFHEYQPLIQPFHLHASQMTKTWWETLMGGSVLSFLKDEWKVSDTGSAH